MFCQSTCVGLRYGCHNDSLRGFSWQFDSTSVPHPWSWAPFAVKSFPLRDSPPVLPGEPLPAGLDRNTISGWSILLLPLIADNAVTAGPEY